MSRRGRHSASLVGAVALACVAACVALIALACGDGSLSWQRTVAFSGGLVLTGCLAAWFIGRWPHRSPAMAVAGGLAAVVVRIMVPLAALAWVRFSDTGPRPAGADLLLLVFYLPLLATDILLNIMEMKRSGRASGGNGAN